MDVELHLPREWDSLPHWVKDELLTGSRDLPFYSWHIQKLVDHAENMKAVWHMFDKHRESFKFKGPVHSLLCVLHYAALGPDPGQPRTDDDRQAISGAIQKHVEGLARQIERLGTSSAFGLYPLGIASAVGVAAWDKAENKVTQPFESTTEQILAVLDRVGIAADARKSVADQLEALQYEIEHEVMELYSDPREAMQALATGAQEWAEDCGWGRYDIIWHIGSSVRDWFGRNHFSATATLTTAITGNEVSEDVVAGVMKRRLRMLSHQKVKV
ncbi:hypothetical protein ARC20_06520 [Stenotrophomonas panacihumi]|uniref:Uncharacterized protein n=1 Tax=Stenotrophomonas panacihumi TaxID=676599 RepID=A0A0R0AXH8_9GAMM|nr:hypothetical protein [Stenotrophomonas panacihumi]KRG46049.1 hypothetical protein ARC20_06520 [Stenotrophomonas panacihumi]PTN56415.1 hypothetical protein C9J98_01510 [Stenotrophomonas panacihumi]